MLVRRDNSHHTTINNVQFQFSAPYGGISSIFWSPRVNIINYTWLKFEGLILKIEEDRPSFAFSDTLITLTQQSTMFNFISQLPTEVFLRYFDRVVSISLRTLC